jgi:uncharacterized RDD family membrane protein YckC/ribosomal protein S27AE
MGLAIGFIGIFIVGMISAIPCYIAYREVSGKDKRWVCPSCGNSAEKLHCGNCGAFISDSVSYAGFRKRLAANTMDTLLFLPLLVPDLFFERFVTLKPEYWWAIDISIAYPLYALFILYIAKYGQTPGKHWVGIRVLKVNLDKVDLWVALKRDALMLIPAFGFQILMVVQILKGAGSAAAMTRSQYYQLVGSENSWITFITQIIFWSELIILMTNDKRRALHDFIAGTVVVDEKTLKFGREKLRRFQWWPR